MPGYIHKPAAGSVGVISRSGTLTYEAVWQLTNLGLRPDPPASASAATRSSARASVDAAARCSRTTPTPTAILMMGEIGGNAEEQAAELRRASTSRKPVAAFIAGQTAPPGKRMGHAGAIISGGCGKAADKIAALKKAGIEVAPTPADLGSAVQKAMAAKKK